MGRLFPLSGASPVALLTSKPASNAKQRRRREREEPGRPLALCSPASPAAYFTPHEGTALGASNCFTDLHSHGSTICHSLPVRTRSSWTPPDSHQLKGQTSGERDRGDVRRVQPMFGLIKDGSQRRCVTGTLRQPVEPIFAQTHPSRRD